MPIVGLWVVPPCSLVSRYSFLDEYRLYLQGRIFILIVKMLALHTFCLIGYHIRFLISEISSYKVNYQTVLNYLFIWSIT
jgi:hypothetical protein